MSPILAKKVGHPASQPSGDGEQTFSGGFLRTTPSEETPTLQREETPAPFEPSEEEDVSCGTKLWYLGANFSMSLAIIWTQKFCTRAGFQWVVVLTYLHWVSTILAVEVMWRVLHKQSTTSRREIDITDTEETSSLSKSAKELRQIADAEAGALSGNALCGAEIIICAEEGKTIHSTSTDHLEDEASLQDDSGNKNSSNSPHAGKLLLPDFIPSVSAKKTKTVYDLSRPELWRLGLLSASVASTTVLNNLSLKYNSVGVFQLLKVLITPATVVFQRVCYGKVRSFEEVCCLALMCCGCTFATVYHVEANFLGSLFGIVGVVTGVMGQVFSETIAKELHLQPTETTHGICLLALPAFTVLLPFAESDLVDFSSSSGERKTLLNFTTWATTALLSALLATCAQAVVLLVTSQGVLRHTGAITYQVSARFKAVALVIGGVVLFREEISLRSFSGMMLVACTIAWYTRIKLRGR